MNTSTSTAYNYKVVRQFAIMTVVWGIVGMGLGVFIAAQLAGYTWAAMKGIPSQLPPDLVAFTQAEQMAKLRRQLRLG